MAEFIFTGDESELLKWFRSVRIPSAKSIVTVSKFTKKRTLNQNAQGRVWYKQISETLTDDNIQGWERYCKLNHGVPILRADDMQYREFYDKAIKSNFSYEDKLRIMDYMPVTRLMNTEQFNRYFEALQGDFINKGVELRFLK